MDPSRHKGLVSTQIEKYTNLIHLEGIMTPKHLISLAPSHQQVLNPKYMKRYVNHKHMKGVLTPSILEGFPPH